MLFQEYTYSVLLVSGGEKFHKSMEALLPPGCFYPIRRVGSGAGARRALLEREYDLVVINAPLPDGPGVQLAMDICARSDAGVLLLVKSEGYEDIRARALERGILTQPKPTSAQLMAQSLQALCAMRERLRGMREKQATVEEKIQEIRLVNRAKWALIRALGMTEEDAHRHIEKWAMEERVSKGEIAKRVLAMYG